MTSLKLFALTLVVVVTLSYAQLAPCKQGDTCSREGESCNTVESATSLKPCDNDRLCFCSPLDPQQFVECKSVVDCEPNQRCGAPTGVSNTKICVGCDSIPVTVTQSDNGSCKIFASPSPSSAITATTTATTIVTPPESTPESHSDPEMTMEPMEPIEPTITPTPVTTMTVVPRDPTMIPIPSSIPDDDMDSEPSPTIPTVTVTTVTALPEVTSDATTSDETIMPTMSMIPTPTTESVPVAGPTTPGTDADPSMESLEPSPDPICVDVEMLKDFAAHELVFDQHRRASVLCDSLGSCATPGHMVHFKGRAMMMQSYCNIMGNCKRTVKLVNSPKFRRGLRVSSKTEQLSFTTFAARYESKVEEHVLKTLIHMGL